MTRQQFVDSILVNANTFEWGEYRLTKKCESLICSGRCSGRNGNCVTCPISEGRQKLAEIFGRVDAPKPVEENVSVKAEAVFTFKGNTFRWI